MYTPLQVDDGLIHNTDDQCLAWAKYIAELFSPLESPRFDNEQAD